MDADRWLDDFFTEDVSLQYANNPIIHGTDVRAMFKMVFAKLDLMTHEILYFGKALSPCSMEDGAVPFTFVPDVVCLDLVESKIYQAATIRYVVKGDDPERDVIQIPGFAVFFLRHQKDGTRPRLYRAETYLNPTEVFARIAEKGL